MPASPYVPWSCSAKGPWHVVVLGLGNNITTLSPRVEQHEPVVSVLALDLLMHSASCCPEQCWSTSWCKRWLLGFVSGHMKLLRANLLGFDVVASTLQVWKRSRAEPMGSWSWKQDQLLPKLLVLHRDAIDERATYTCSLQNLSCKKGASSSLTTVDQPPPRFTLSLCRFHCCCWLAAMWHWWRWAKVHPNPQLCSSAQWRQFPRLQGA